MFCDMPSLENRPTKRQMQAWKLFEKGMTQVAIARKLKISRTAVRNLIREAKYRIESGGVTIGQKSTAVEDLDPEMGVEGLEIATDPTLGRVRKALRAVGFNEATTRGFMRRIERERNGAVLLARSVKTRDLLALVSDRAHRILESIDASDIDEATLRDKATSIGILIDKRQLLSGEPTQILSIPERGKLNDLVEIVVKEARRRGLQIDATGQVPQVLAPEGEDVEKLMPIRVAKLLKKTRDPKR